MEESVHSRPRTYTPHDIGGAQGKVRCCGKVRVFRSPGLLYVLSACILG